MLKIKIWHSYKTIKVNIKKLKCRITFASNQTFVKGNYTIQIYQNVFKIGEDTRELKKGGLFS